MTSAPQTLAGTGRATPSVSVLSDRSDRSDRAPDGRGEQRTALLLVDQTHPFFFDHPLDHVPATLLTAGLLELAGPPGDPTGGRVLLRLRVPTMAEFGAPVSLSAELPRSSPGRHWSVRVAQVGNLVAEGELRFDPDLDPEPAAAGGARSPAGLRPEPVQAELVHRRRPENVLLGAPRTRGEWLVAPLLPPPPGHYLSGREPVSGGIETLIEAGRQFGILYCHVVAQRREQQILLLGVTADLPVLAPAGGGVTLRSRVETGHRSRGRLVTEYLDGGPEGPRLGELAVDYLTVSEAAYRRLRSRRAER